MLDRSRMLAAALAALPTRTEKDLQWVTEAVLDLTIRTGATD